jgi:hypothetical protein
MANNNYGKWSQLITDIGHCCSIQSRPRNVGSSLTASFAQRLCSQCWVVAFAVITLVSLAQAQSLPPQFPVVEGMHGAEGPLVVNQRSQVVVMEYEAWFGPNAVTFQAGVGLPLLQSADMQAIGGGYDSADPAVIERHVDWMEDMGIDAALIEVTNNVSCIFNSKEFARKYLQNCTELFRSENQSIRNNTGNLYPAWSKLGTRLKLIPLLGGIDQDVLYKDTDGKTALEKELEYFGARIEKHPNLSVIYEGKPLILIYLGAAQDPTPSDKPLWLQIRQFLESHPGIADKYTFRMMAGYLDSQSALWADQSSPDGPVKINPEYGFWSWVDRLKPSCTFAPCPYYPSYNKVGPRVENFTASVATAGQSGWGCPNSTELPYCPDDALRYGKNDSYETFDSFMDYAGKLKPIFLILHQFNEFNLPDEGWDANTDDDIEPADQWGTSALKIVREQICRYRRETRPERRLEAVLSSRTDCHREE